MNELAQAHVLACTLPHTLMGLPFCARYGTREYTPLSPQNLPSSERDGITKQVNNPFAVILAAKEMSQGKGRQNAFVARLHRKGAESCVSD